MALRHDAHPTPANIRTRVNQVLKAAEQLETMLGRYNPKGRLSEPTRRGYCLARQWKKDADRLYEDFSRVRR